MTVLVTGSSGHLGEALMRTLGASGRPAVGLDVISGPFTDEVGSIADRACVKRCMDGVDTVLHAATLHKPHVATHAREAFVETNVLGALILLEEAARARVRAFVMTSTTSAFGDALKPPPRAPAAWIDERVAPVPKNIYGVTKTAAEDLCQLFRRNEGLASIVLCIWFLVAEKRVSLKVLGVLTLLGVIGHERVQLCESGNPRRESPPTEHRSALVHHQHVVVGLGPIDAHEDHLLCLPLDSTMRSLEPREDRGDLMDQCSDGTPSHQPSISSPTGRGTL